MFFVLGSDVFIVFYVLFGNVYVVIICKLYCELEFEIVVNFYFVFGLCEFVVVVMEGVVYSCFDDYRIGLLKKGYKVDFVVVDMEWENEKLM